MSSIYFKTALFGFITGIGTFSFLPIFPKELCFLLIGIVLFFCIVFRKFQFTSLFCFFFLFVVFAGLRVNFNQHVVNSQTIDFYNDTDSKIAFRGTICEEPDLRVDKGKYTVCAETFFFENYEKEIEGRVLVSVDRLPEYSYGDMVKITGSLKTPVEFEDFSYRDYLSRFNIFSVMYSPRIQVLETSQGNLFYAKIFDWKRGLEDRINRIYPEPNSSFLAGLLIGARRSIPESVMSDFNITGLTHIIAISGYNITIIIVFIMGMLRFLPRKIAFYIAIVGIIVFTIFVGASAAVVRAAIMGILGLIALNYGRQSDVTVSILLTATLMVGWNPKILVYDVGFQLSFLAVLGLVYVAPFFDKWMQKIPETLGLREALQMTLSAQVTAVPLILLNFERLSLISPIANILVAPFIPLAMLFGFVSILVSFVSFQLSLVVGFLAFIFLEIILYLNKWLAVIPYASVEVEGVGVLVVGGYYVILSFWIYRKNRKG